DDALGEQKRPRELDLEHAMPHGLVELGDGHAIVAARIGGVVDEHVDAPEGCHATIDEILDRLGAAHVADPRHRAPAALADLLRDRESTRLNSSHTVISYAVFC